MRYYGKSDADVFRRLDVEKYMGKWFEIYRLPMRAEKDLVNVSATYALRTDGKVDVLNQGYKHTPEGKHKKAKALAWLPDPEIQGALIVRFFGLFKSSYHILFIDEDYQFAVVSTHDRNYAWILARTPLLNKNFEDELLTHAKGFGIDTSKFIKTLQKWQ